MKNHVVMFCENKNPTAGEISSDSKIFCIPFYKIQEAMEFCELEEIYGTYLGFRHKQWLIDPDKTGMSPYIKITRDGIHEDNKKRFVWVLKKINFPTTPCTHLQSQREDNPSCQGAGHDSKQN